MTATLLSLLGQIHPVLQNLSGIPLGIFLLVTALTATFLLGYLVQGSRVGVQLGSALRQIRKLSAASKKVKPADVRAAMSKEPLKHLWDEYEDTLHELKKAGNGELSLTEVRATVPAEMFFTRDVLVDSRLFDDFTRHLPGVLTGLGIIGTFAGLLEGLSKFDASNTATAVAGLKPLLDGVAHAFVASAIAIGCAMLVTFLSRFFLAMFYRQVEKLCHAIDSLYETGAGEEYLSRLVQASEKNEAHSAQLKQALVEDLTQMMTNLVDRQIQAQAESNRALGAHIGEAITGTLAGPLKQMTEAMETSSKGNTQAVTGMLETMLAGFMGKLEDTFGGQMRGIHDQMDRSVGMMTTVQEALQKLVQDINSSNEQAASRMSGTLEDAMKQSAANQQLLTDQMRQFVDDFRKLVSDEQAKSKKTMDDAIANVLQSVDAAVKNLEAARTSAQQADAAHGEKLAARSQEALETVTRYGAAATSRLSNTIDETLKKSADNQTQMADQMRAFLADAQQRSSDELTKSRQAMDESVGKVLQQLTTAVEQMETVRKAAASQEQSRSDKLANRTQELVGGLTDQVEGLLKAVQDQVAKTQQNIDAISSVTTRAIDGMNAGALNMGTAAQRFETAGGAVSGVFEKSAQVAIQLATTSGSLQAAAAAVKQGFDQYETTRRTVDSNVSALTALIENAKKEAGLSRQMLTDLERIVGQLKTAETQSLQYLEGVNKTLTTAFQNFGTQLTEQVRKAVGETDRQLGGGVQQLTGVVQELGSALSRLKKA
jgi:hypothetical protein